MLYKSTKYSSYFGSFNFLSGIKLMDYKDINKMRAKIKCPYCAYLFYLKDAEVTQTNDKEPNLISNIKKRLWKD